MAMMAIAAEACWCASNLIGFTTNSTRLGTTAAKMTFSANRSTSDSNHPFRAARPMAHTNWTPRHEYLLDTTHHFSLRRIEVLDLTGDGVDQHVIESEFGGADRKSVV